MGQVTVRKENNIYYVECPLKPQECFSPEEEKQIQNNLSELVLPVMSCKNTTVASLTCTAKGLISLEDYLGRIIEKQTFIEVIVQVIMVIRMVEQSGLTVHNIELDYDKIFIDSESLCLYFVYWPIEQSTRRVDLEYFFNEMAYRCIFSGKEDNNYVTQYIRFFQKEELFSLSNFEQMMMLLANDELEQISNVSVMTKELKLTQNQGETMVLDSDFWERMNATRNGKVDKENVCKTTMHSQPVSSFGNLNGGNSDETGVLTPEMMDFLNPNASQQRKVTQPRPYLIREAKGERILIHKTEFIIGKDRSVSDYVITNNTTISRKHASIFVKGVQYFVVDHGSTNGTFVNGQQIEPEKEVELSTNMHLKLSDEEFTFYIME